MNYTMIHEGQMTLPYNILLYNNILIYNITSPTLEKLKGKAIPLQAWTGREGSKSLRLPDIKTIGT